VRRDRSPVLTLTGWAADPKTRAPASSVVVAIDDVTATETSYGSERNDVASYWGHSELRYTGYTASIPTASLTPGTHELAFRVLSSDGSTLFEVGRRVIIKIL
jgi:hypothetical protein